MLTNYDYVVIGFFFLFMLALGPIFKHFSKNDSDYFRGGAQMLWWMVGASAFMTQFSAWTFTGAASKAYQDGTLVAMIFFANALGFFFNIVWFAPRFRQMRLVTAIESVRERFGAANEQVFTWLQIPMSLVYAAIWLNGLAVFSSAIFGFPMTGTIWIVGFVVIVLSVAGGSWAIVAGDFVQLLILMCVSIVTAVLVLSHTDIGGLSGLIDKVPSHHFNWKEAARPQIIYLWIAATFVKQFFVINNMQDSYRYLGVKDGGQARKAAILATVLMFIGPMIWFIPPMAARVFAPDIAEVFPNVKNPAEASYILAASRTVPIGMLGLLVCGLFSATISSMDSGLNRNAGIFIRSFYQRIGKAKSSIHLLVAGRIASTVFGVLIILIAIYISKLEDMDLFNAMMLFSGLIAVPYIIPLLWGMVIKKTPSWSGWSTVLIGLMTSLIIKYKINPSWFGQVCGFEGEMTSREIKDYYFIFGVLANVVICSAWFLFTRLFYETSPVAYRERVEKFFVAMGTPVDFKAEVGEAKDNAQSRMLGILCFVYGGFVLLLVLIPNPLLGRAAFLFCGGVIAGVGGLLYRSSKKKV
ncbi:transporter [Planctomycetota bacterium]